MSSKPLISVIVPARNEEEFLGGCLQALSGQDYPNYEIIVIDNASTDETAEIARKFKVRLVFEKKVGLSFARERGFTESRGDIIARTDADSVPPEDWLSKISEILKNNPEAVAVSGSDEFFDRGKVVRYCSRVAFLVIFYLTRMLFGHYQLSGPNFAIRKKTLKNIKFHTDDKKIHEDMDIACHIRKSGKIMFMPSLVMPISGRKLKNDPGHLLKYLKKTVYTYLLHHPVHKWHSV